MASCVGCDWQLWFPNGNTREGLPAKQICLTCPVRDLCAQDVLNQEEAMPEAGVIRAGVYVPPQRRGTERVQARAKALAQLETIALGEQA